MNFNKKELDVIARAMAILEERARYETISFAAPNAVADYLRLRVGGLEHEVFGVLWLPDGHFKFPHFWPPKLPQARRCKL